MIPTVRRPAMWFWIAALLALFWNIVGVYACFTQLTVTPEQLAALPPAQRDAWVTMPMLVRAAYAVAVGAGLIGAILLLARRALARALFFLSLAGVVVQFGWFYLIWGGLAKVGPTSIAFPAVIALVCLVEIGVAGIAIRRRWIA